jgi:hypothetical protein
MLNELAAGVGGKIDECFRLPDGSGGAVMSMPLPENHWIYGKDDPVHPEHGFTYYAPPMPWRMGSADPRRQEWAEKIKTAGKYAIRASTDSGKEIDFDPDAMLQNLVVGMLGYWTETGLSQDEWANPTDSSQPPEEQPPPVVQSQGSVFHPHPLPPDHPGS